ncbi:hypothetical protein AAG747_10710 [Rapidithrix thailandica]|uniref:DNA mismatch repair proteins mutS family domain-containing protein n=1 Tax=Rapidithrix thailandica TaxID=413964 RepID=A0AAW9SBV1_9BACT
MNPNTALDFFTKNIDQYQGLFTTAQAQYNRLSVLRTLWFLAIGIGIVYFANERQAALMFTCLFVGALVFILMIKRHRKIGESRDVYQNLLQINQEEKHRCNFQFELLAAKGEAFDKEQHPYTGDLDIFGKYSLFQYLNRATTLPGQATLASWLKHAASSQEITARQKAIKELADNIHWCQEVQASGRSSTLNDAGDLPKLYAWTSTSEGVFQKPALKVMAKLLPFALLISVGLAYWEYVPNILPVTFFLIQSLLLGKNFKTVSQTLEETSQSIQVLKVFEKTIRKIENQSFQAPWLQEQQAKLSSKKYLVSAEIKRLATLLERLEYRQNPWFFVFVNWVTLFEVHMMIGLEKWKARHQSHIQDWIEVVGNIEAALSLAGYCFSNPENAFPEIENQEAPFIYQTEALGHPLINTGERVVNDCEISGKGKCILITGSNMSGKSTFLRTLGINAVLAFTGAPVCAKRLRLSPFQVFTSMRTKDSLHDHVSSFYAELQRIQQLLSQIKQGEPVFYLLDELLKGTNSKDRHQGIKALTRQLLQAQATGCISTHDLELVGMEKHFPEHLINYSFNSSLQNGKLHFDYHLHKGPCFSFSASALMKEIGIELDVEE